METKELGKSIVCKLKTNKRKLNVKDKIDVAIEHTTERRDWGRQERIGADQSKDHYPLSSVGLKSTLDDAQQIREMITTGARRPRNTRFPGWASVWGCDPKKATTTCVTLSKRILFPTVRRMPKKGRGSKRCVRVRNCSL